MAVNLKRFGFVRTPGDDFSDDGNRFVTYKLADDARVTATRLTSDGEVYFDVVFRSAVNFRFSKYFGDLNGVSASLFTNEAVEKLMAEVHEFVDNHAAEYDRICDMSDAEIADFIKTIDTDEAASNWQYLDKKICEALDCDDRQLKDGLHNRVLDAIFNANKLTDEQLDDVAKATVKNWLKDVARGSRFDSYSKELSTILDNGVDALEDTFYINRGIYGARSINLRIGSEQAEIVKEKIKALLAPLCK